MPGYQPFWNEKHITMPLLRTKLNIPRVYSDLLERPRLTARLDEGTRHKLTLISAPAGFGKTTVLSSWAVKTNITLAWVSLDEHDNDPVRFWSYLITALQALHTGDHGQTGIGKIALAMIQSQQAPPLESILTELLNDVAAVPWDFVLVLDDYHNITNQTIHESLVFFIDNLPPQAHVFITSRVDPPLPLPRWRVRREMVELSVDDIRFTSEETEAFLNLIMGLTLSSDTIAILENLTEGWVAALKLAALSMQGTGKTSDFIKSFAGDNRYIFDYLAEEVLNRQPEDIRRFLLQTSVLERLNAALCDTVTEQPGSQKMLERLEHAHLFIVPLDQYREWYRYHRLFSDFLRAQLRRETGPETVAALHRRASLGYEQHDLYVEAVSQAFAIPDYELVVHLVKNEANTMFPNSEILTLLRWLGALPNELVSKDAELSLNFAWALLATGQSDAVEPHLCNIERVMGITADNYRDCDFSPPSRIIAGQILCIRANIAIYQGDFSRALSLSKMADTCLNTDLDMEYASPQRQFLGLVKFNMALAYELSDDMLAADRAFHETISLEETTGNPHIILLASSHLAQLQVIQGHLHKAEEIYRVALQRVSEFSHPSPLSGMISVGLGNIFREWNQLDRALSHLTQGIEMGRVWNNWETTLPGYLGLANIKAASGDAEGAEKLVMELEGLALKLKVTGALSLVRAHRARLLARQGSPEVAERWLENTVVEFDSDIPFLQEPEAILRAQILLALGRHEECLKLTARLLRGAEAGKRWGRVIEILVVQALSLQQKGNTEKALESLANALELAEPEGYVRIFVDEGPPMMELLELGLSRHIHPAYLRSLLAAFEVQQNTGTVASGARQQGLAEPLSEREMEVLNLLSSGLTNQEIADELVLSVNTVKTHVKNIHSKLGTRNRTEAATRAQEMGLLPK